MRHIVIAARDRAVMLAELGFATLDDLIDAAVPDGIRSASDLVLPEAASEAQATLELAAIAARNVVSVPMIGLGYSPTVTPVVIRRKLLQDPAWYTSYVALLGYYAIEASILADQDVLLARTGSTGKDGFEIYCHPSAAVFVWDALTRAGKEHGLVPAGLACRDSLRLEAGMPLYGHELTRGITPYEAGLGKVVSLGKDADFVGRAALEKRGRTGPSTLLVGLVSLGRRAPRSGQAVVNPATGDRVGEVTSGMPSPTLGVPIAMAFVPADLSVPGTRLQVELRGVREAVDVVPLPFYRRAA